MQFVDHKLASRIEATERIAQLRYAEALVRVKPEAGVTIEEIGGGHMVFCGVNSPIGRAIGMGLNGRVTAEEIDRVETFYFSRGADAQIDVVPAADESLFRLLRERPYRLFELNNVMVLQLDPQRRFNTEVPDAEIRRAAAGDELACARILEKCFVDTPPDLAETIAPMFEAPAIAFLASLDGKPVATAAGLVSEEHQLLALFGAGTLPQHRGRGLQTALLGARLNAAKDAGCTLAVTVTRGGTTSQRNAERLGFRVAYSKATMIRSRAE